MTDPCTVCDTCTVGMGTFQWQWQTIYEYGVIWGRCGMGGNCPFIGVTLVWQVWVFFNSNDKLSYEYGVIWQRWGMGGDTCMAFIFQHLYIFIFRLVYSQSMSDWFSANVRLVIHFHVYKHIYKLNNNNTIFHTSYISIFDYSTIIYIGDHMILLDA